MNPFESYTADINALITESQIQLYINSFKDKFLYIDDKIDDKIDNKIDDKIHQYNDLLGSNGYIAAVYKVPYVDTDFLTMYYILKYNDENFNNPDKTRKTRIKNGTQINDELVDGFINYKKIKFQI